MLKSKRAEGTAFGWILGLVTLLVLGLLYIILNQGMVVHIIPAFDGVKQTIAIEGQHLNSSQIADMQSDEDFYLAIWGFVPILIFAAVLIWIIFNAVRRNKEDMYQ
jgi:hypothetical protein